ncbi:MerR family transcriptional regulator [Ramlibacter sp. AN1015]|uniref:MerR family transcriptional regulator n=1 Tax=Ramlibacter sp. AN1015 TaxID=3133428 RepID=UPI0030C14C97
MDKETNCEPQFSIAAVEREVGLSKDVLRVWERRYGFPTPSRGVSGERLYAADQVLRLRLIRRLMDQGLRPGRLLGMTPEALHALASAGGSGAGGNGAGGNGAGGGAGAYSGVQTGGSKDGENALGGTAADLLASVRRHDAPALFSGLQQRLAQQGLANFVQDTLAPLAFAVGEEWARGSMEVFAEHLFTEQATRLLRQAIAALPAGGAPVVLLTTVPDEPHGLGLLMVEALLTLEGARCVNLGVQMPLLDIARASEALGADVVALSFSAAFAARRIPPLLLQLRQGLSPRVQLWAGGAAVQRLAGPDGVRVLATFDAAAAAIKDWRLES